MPRIRTIKPEIWTDEALGACPLGARLLYVGLITQADDAGRLRAAPALLRGAIFPYDRVVSTDKVAAWLGALETSGLLVRYDVSGERYAVLNGWHHQRINRPTPSRLPDPPNGNGAFPAHSVSPHVERSEDARRTPRGKGREGKDYVLPPSRSTNGARAGEDGSSATSPPAAVRAAAWAGGDGYPVDA